MLAACPSHEVICDTTFVSGALCWHGPHAPGSTRRFLTSRHHLRSVDGNKRPGRRWKAAAARSTFIGVIVFKVILERGTKPNHRRCSRRLLSARGLSDDGFVAATGEGTWAEASSTIKVAAAPGRDGFDAGFAFVSREHVLERGGLADIISELKMKLRCRQLIGCVAYDAYGVTGSTLQSVRKESDRDTPGKSRWSGVEAFSQLFNKPSSSRTTEIEKKRPALSVGLFRKIDAVPFIVGRDGRSETLKVAREKAGIFGIILLADATSGADTAIGLLGQMFPFAQTVGALAAEPVLDKHGCPMPVLAAGAIMDEGWPAGPCGSVRLFADGAVGLLLRGVEIDTIAGAGTKVIGR